jgi:hypothetical protein
MNKALVVFPVAAVLLCGTVSASSASRDARHAKEEARLDKALAGKVAGKPVSCIRLRDAQGTESFDNEKGTILFRVSRKLVYRTDTNGGCRDIGRTNALITRSFNGSQLCRGDIATSADLTAGFSSGSCSMNDFVPYRGS